MSDTTTGGWREFVDWALDRAATGAFLAMVLATGTLVGWWVRGAVGVCP